MIRDFVAPELRSHFPDGDLFEQINRMQGQVFREVAARRTFKVAIGGKPYFVKLHHGVGWGEIFKNLFQGRLPVLGARHEWLAIERLTACGVPTMTASLYCERGRNPASLRSAIVTESLEPATSLEDYEPPDPAAKRRILAEVAHLSRRMHLAGVNHRDFYLCHFLMRRRASTDAPVTLHLIDLHRAQVRGRVPRRWLIKDLGGLLFSALNKGLTRRDLLRFVRIYSNRPLREALGDKALWRGVIARTVSLYRQDHEFIPARVVQLLGSEPGSQPGGSAGVSDGRF